MGVVYIADIGGAFLPATADKFRYYLLNSQFNH
jgi:hypothetical protein